MTDVKLIGKRNLSYERKAAYTLINEDIDRGNSLEMILLLAKYDPALEVDQIKVEVM